MASNNRGLSVQPGKRMDWLGGWTHQKQQKLWKLIGYFQKAPGPSQARDSMITLTKKLLLSLTQQYTPPFLSAFSPQWPCGTSIHLWPWWLVDSECGPQSRQSWENKLSQTDSEKDLDLAWHKMSGPDEGKIRLFPWQDEQRWDIGNSHDFATKSYHQTLSSLVGLLECFPCNTAKTHFHQQQNQHLEAVQLG